MKSPSGHFNVMLLLDPLAHPNNPSHSEMLMTETCNPQNWPVFTVDEILALEGNPPNVYNEHGIALSPQEILTDPEAEKAFAERKRERNAKVIYYEAVAEWAKLPWWKRALSRKPRFRP